MPSSNRITAASDSSAPRTTRPHRMFDCFRSDGVPLWIVAISLLPWTSNAEFVAVQVEKRRKLAPAHLCGLLGENDLFFLQVRIHPVDVVTLEDNGGFVLAPIRHQLLRVQD